MQPGDKLRFRGPAGNEFVVTVGPAFDERTIRRYVQAGEWTPVDLGYATTVAKADAAQVRAWAAANGIQCPAKGRVPLAVVQAYIKAHQES